MWSSLLFQLGRMIPSLCYLAGRCSSSVERWVPNSWHIKHRVFFFTSEHFQPAIARKVSLPSHKLQELYFEYIFKYFKRVIAITFCFPFKSKPKI